MADSPWDWKGYSTGGALRSDSFSGMQPDFSTSLANMFQNAPPEIQSQLRVSSGYRSVARQQELWDQALQKYGSPEAARKWVAPPGNSQHNHGNAADLSYLNPAAQKWAHENAAQYGMAFPLANENWHIELAGARGGNPQGGAGNTTLNGGDGNEMLGMNGGPNYRDPGAPLTPLQVQQQADQAESPLPKWLQKLTPEWLNHDRSEKLLAIGSGLLSGDDWASGISGAADGLRGVSNEQKQRDLQAAQYGDGAMRDEVRFQNQSSQHQWDAGRDDARYADTVRNEQKNAERDQGYAMDRQAAALTAADASVGLQRIPSVVMKDGTERSDLSFNSRTGKTQDSQGNDMSDLISHPQNNSDAAGSKGSPTGTQVGKMQMLLNEQSTGLETMDRLYENMGTTPGGVEKLGLQVSTFYNTLIGRNLTPEQIQLAISTGDMQGLIGATRTSVVGGGVMTEADAFRVLQYLGGDLNLFSTNPQVIRERIRIGRDNLDKQYRSGLEQYNLTKENYPNNPMIDMPEYLTPDGLYSDGTPVQVIPTTTPTQADAPLDQSNAVAPSGVPEGITPEQWAVMSPAQRLRAQEAGALSTERLSNIPPAPEGIPQAVWREMSPEEWALWE
jgi:hypothetical protein